ncbi:MAG: phosphoribosyltransferase [Spirochaetaceae bacterium]|nr:phosphoribosyltransferase [Spirochaetaceae bacterium]MCF7949067.1 phosphoribosyltransferase [Spirochaetia bacterium]MCF7950423.1 phosphoribosyltransferase [Spirochaetaceae bacterium]
MMKDFVEYDQVRNNSLKLAYTIHKDGFIPDVIYVLLRGGAYIGNVISEYFKIVRKDERPVFYAAVVARSYTDIHKRSRVMIDGWTYKPEYLRNGDKVLLVDDIYDSGRTMNYLAEVIMDHGIPRDDLKIAVHDYKVFPDSSEQMPVSPDYFCRKHTVTSPENDVWIHYKSHELVGLTKEEFLNNYSFTDKGFIEILDKELFNR